MRRTISLILLLAACGGPADLPCVQNLSTNCQPLFDPQTFTMIYTEILHPTCASGHGTCHTTDFAPRGLVFEDQQTSYNLLLGLNGAPVRVTPGDPSCSLLMRRLQSSDSSTRMPPGNTPLTQPQLCAISKWIANGAQP